MTGYGELTPELEAWMAAHHDPTWKPTKTRRITVPRRRANPNRLVWRRARG